MRDKNDIWNPNILEMSRTNGQIHFINLKNKKLKSQHVWNIKSFKEFCALWQLICFLLWKKRIFFFFLEKRKKRILFSNFTNKKITKLKRVLITANQLLEDAKDDSKIAQFPEFQNEEVVSLINKLLEDIYC